MPEQTFPLFPVVLISVGLGLLVFVVITTTAFVKVSVVLFIVRSALGIQQTPPNLVLYGIALSLTAFIAAPVVNEVQAAVTAGPLRVDSFEDWLNALNRAREPVREFLVMFSHPEQRTFFLSATNEIWPEDMRASLNGDDLSILIPSFLVSELQRAFQIGFLLYLPFVIIDLVVTTILMAMGMSMVTPTVISVPLKLFVFVSIDGWGLLVEGLIISYAA
ncbi:MAG: type III secretion system export apparatus subunit SctR [Pseudomonadota bacterium]